MKRKQKLINSKAQGYNRGVHWLHDDEENLNLLIYPVIEVKKFILEAISLIHRPLPKTSASFSAAVDSLYQRLNAFNTEAGRLQIEIARSSLPQNKKRELSKALQNSVDNYTVQFQNQSVPIIVEALENFSDEFKDHQQFDNTVTSQSGVEIFMSHFALDQLETVVHKQHFPNIKEKIINHKFYEEEIDLSFPEEYKSVNDMFTEVKNTYIDYVVNELEKKIKNVKLIDRILALATTSKLEVYEVVANTYNDVSSVNKAAEFFKNEIDAIVTQKIDSLRAEYHRAKEDILFKYLSHLGNLNNEGEVVEWVFKVKQFAFDTVCGFFDNPQNINAELKNIRDIVDKHATQKIQDIEFKKKMRLERPRSLSFLLDFENSETESDDNPAEQKAASNANDRRSAVAIPEDVSKFISGPRFVLFRRQQVEAIKSREERLIFNN